MAREVVQVGRYVIDKSSVDAVIKMLSRVLSEEAWIDGDLWDDIAGRLLVGMMNSNEHAELGWILDTKYEVEDLPPSTVPIPYPPRA